MSFAKWLYKDIKIYTVKTTYTHTTGRQRERRHQRREIQRETENLKPSVTGCCNGIFGLRCSLCVWLVVDDVWSCLGRWIMAEARTDICERRSRCGRRGLFRPRNVCAGINLCRSRKFVGLCVDVCVCMCLPQSWKGNHIFVCVFAYANAWVCLNYEIIWRKVRTG